MIRTTILASNMSQRGAIDNLTASGIIDSQNVAPVGMRPIVALARRIGM